ncbi:MAG: DNA-binding response regulator [Sphingobacteriales bacterium 50-39]|nr:response regulator transcription factor [Sphingobacteriales bacterium]OJW60990.1 MAG: DNA-binding response regulator [Sphingobacteriales bacterium 50-39]
MLKAIIVDDEPDCSESLATMLRRYCPEVEVAAICNSGASALQEIPSHNPQLVFLDIEMPHMNGFEMIERLPEIGFELIFTTSYDQYAIKAIKFSALDYLLKPVDREELKIAVKKVTERHQPPLPQQLEILLQKFHQPATTNQRIAIPTLEGLLMVPIDSITHCQSDSNYTIFHLKNQQKITACRNLKEVEEVLEGRSFVRVHHSYLVNINEIQKYVKGEGGYLIMSDGNHIDVSRSRKELLLQKLKPNRL